ncbi:hypothetical protein HELRODRAFT_169006 [Helobdella robusta]|uniref:Uncharacterized protein n=1 Tax=Helobdella robusta TaxID=6412 RepID=T1F192_HELRO|nr:hypothetical protein HELRODRAFT_169006 [Helobdella robusta]ESO09069.1 hypothetical protein HELRODRAFT_169006 [Helobdella robusta]
MEMKKRWHEMMKIRGNRFTFSKLYNILLDHSNLTHNYLTTKTEPPMFEHCRDNLTISHVFKCENTKDKRTMHSGHSEISENFKTRDNQMIIFLKELGCHVRIKFKPEIMLRVARTKTKKRKRNKINK